MLRIFGTSDRGHVRPVNQDCFGIDERVGLCVVADGMGGHNAGEIAARLAVDTVTDHVRASCDGQTHDSIETDGRLWPFGYDRSLSLTGNRLRAAVQLANFRVLESARASEDRSGMGTTIVAALVRDDRLSVAHVGDSRLYICARERLRQVTGDDSWVATFLAREPDADLLALSQHPLRHVLTNVVGVHPVTEVHVSEEALEGETLLILTTDGVHGVVLEECLERLAAQKEVPQLADQLVRTALRMGSRDNCTAIVAHYLPAGRS